MNNTASDDGWRDIGEIDEYTPHLLLSNGDGVWAGTVYIEVDGSRIAKALHCLRSNASPGPISHYQRIPLPPLIQKAGD